VCPHRRFPKDYSEAEFASVPFFCAEHPEHYGHIDYQQFAFFVFCNALIIKVFHLGVRAGFTLLASSSIKHLSHQTITQMQGV